ncbi:hypothetical protein IHN32_02085 [Deinococcus sp. 14RED07]|uniref:TRADD-N-associated membrane domain-containing protein n=1 Tax=Deinococcus sp. 14RED07 TaxID=2745874 RepID=UPI001E65D3F7|nr:hypothetical protein [Deinococcus sp. 14RED07]MCD0174743.1 hypothetical protein [Deinococcus sp. 14RED07]
MGPISDSFLRGIEYLPIEKILELSPQLTLSEVSSAIYKKIAIIKNRLTKSLMVIIPLTIVCSLMFYFVASRYESRIFSESDKLAASIAILLYGAVIAFTYYISSQNRIRVLKTELEILQIRYRPYKSASEFESRTGDVGANNSSKPSYFDQLVKINLDNLSEYYTLTKVSTSNSFNASLYSGVVGFLILVSGIILSIVADKVAIGTITIISGVIVEFIAGVFFILYFKSVEKLREYHDSLIQVQNILLSFKIMEDIKEEQERIKMATLVLNLMHGVKAP